MNESAGSRRISAAVGGGSKPTPPSERRGIPFLVNRKALLVNRKALLVDGKAFLVSRKALLVSRKALLANRKAFLVSRKALLANRKALLVNRKALLVDRKAFLVSRKALLVERTVLRAAAPRYPAGSWGDAHDNSSSRSSRVKRAIRLSSAWTIASARVRLPFCNSRIFSSTVSWATSR